MMKRERRTNHKGKKRARGLDDHSSKIFYPGEEERAFKKSSLFCENAWGRAKNGTFATERRTLAGKRKRGIGLKDW